MLIINAMDEWWIGPEKSLFCHGFECTMKVLRRQTDCNTGQSPEPVTGV